MSILGLLIQCRNHGRSLMCNSLTLMHKLPRVLDCASKPQVRHESSNRENQENKPFSHVGLWSPKGYPVTLHSLLVETRRHPWRHRVVTSWHDNVSVLALLSKSTDPTGHVATVARTPIEKIDAFLTSAGQPRLNVLVYTNLAWLVVLMTLTAVARSTSVQLFRPRPPLEEL